MCSQSSRSGGEGRPGAADFFKIHDSDIPGGEKSVVEGGYVRFSGCDRELGSTGESAVDDQVAVCG